jgi:integrase/recombinase XerD
MMRRNGPPLTKLFLSYLAIEKGLSQNTIANYANDLARLTHFAYQAHKPIEQLRARDLRQFIAQLNRERLSPATIRRVASTIRGFYAFLVLDDYIDTPPTDDLNTPPPVSYLPRYLTETQIHALFGIPDVTNAEGLRDRAILELMYAAGLRVSEVLSLLHKHIDLRNGLLTCVGKGRKERTIPFGRSAAFAIENYVAAKPFAVKTPNSHVFLIKQKPLTRQFLWTLISRYGAAAAIDPISPHTLRHTFATHLLQHGAELKHVQALLGHADISTTAIYTHISEKYLSRSYSKHHPRAR